MVENDEFKWKPVRNPTGTFSLGEVLGRGAEGTVYHLSKAVKIFRDDIREMKAAKVKVMVENLPVASTHEGKVVRIFLWPEAVIEDPETEEFLGYLMQYKDLTDVKSALEYAITELRWAGSKAEHRLRVARHMAGVVHALHKQGHAFGDLNHANFLINEDGGIMCVDCDRFWIQSENETYPGDTFSPRYGPPDGLRDTLAEVQQADRFGLAVHIFQLLMEGFHPFLAQGSEAEDGDWADMIEANPFPYNTADTEIRPPDEAPDYNQLPAEVKQLFEQSFRSVPDEKDKERPDPEEWIEAINSNLPLNTGLNKTNIDPTLARKPIVFVLDTSGLTKNQISALNKELEFFQSEMERKEDLISQRIEIALVSSSGNVTIEQEFTPFENWELPVLNTGDESPMGEAIITACNMVEDRRDEYKRAGIPYKIPEIWLLASTNPTDMNERDQMWTRVEKTLVKQTNENNIRFIPAGIDGASLEILSELVSVTDTTLPLLRIKEEKNMFRDYFGFIAESPWDYHSVVAYTHAEDIVEDSDILSFVD